MEIQDSRLGIGDGLGIDIGYWALDVAYSTGYLSIGNRPQSSLPLPYPLLFSLIPPSLSLSLSLPPVDHEASSSDNVAAPITSLSLPPGPKSPAALDFISRLPLLFHPLVLCSHWFPPPLPPAAKNISSCVWRRPAPAPSPSPSPSPASDEMLHSWIPQTQRTQRRSLRSECE